MRFHRYLVPVAAAGLLAGCGAGAGTRAGDPPKLAIGTAAAMAELTADGPAGYRLVVTLPDGPAQAPVRHLVGEVDPATVTRLARALGFTSTPDRHPYGWQVGRPGRAMLTVRSDGTGQWTYVSPYVQACDDVAVDSAPGDRPDATTCTVSPSRPSTQAPDTSVARAVARPVLAAVGLESARASVSDWGEVTQVRADPTVEGLPAFGLGTSVQTAVVRGTPLVLSASGHLTTATEPGDTYPLITARAAWRQLAQREAPAIALVCPQQTPGGPDRWTTDDGAPDAGERAVPEATAPASPPGAPTDLPAARCAQDPVEVDSVTLGLTVRYVADSPVLVPAWLFTARGGELLEMVAVDPAYLTDPADPGTGGGSGEAPGSVGESPAGPATVEPAPAAGAASPGVS